MHITEDERTAVYKTIYARRDVRNEFKPDEVPQEVIQRILMAAHHAPSVGFMQPWDFLVIKDIKIKQQIKNEFIKANTEAAKMFNEKKTKEYKALKLEGILEAPIGICVTCDRTRNGPTVLGRTSIPEMDLYSSVCAIQNMWLAARAENLGMGWVSIIHNDALQRILNIPTHIVPIAYLCIGYVTHFRKKPELEENGWIERENLEKLVHFDGWGNQKYSK
ncbi:MAG: 5,6-dimethylbenzimidazole synthase [Cocleimonas sp.]|nr:5,6-dimethylbenzimidazole synthase [Cocleimonas sp.]